MQKQQATGIDTFMMIPVYAAIYAGISQCFLPWISIPSLKYSDIPSKYTVFQMQGFLWLKILLVGIVLLMAGGIFFIFLKKEKSERYIRIIFGIQFLYTVLQQILVLRENFLINSKNGIENNFMNLSIYSKIQLTSWVYALMILSCVLFFVCEKLFNVSGETKQQRYIERSIKEDKKIGKRTKLSILIILAGIPFLIFFGIFFLNDRSSVFIGLCIVCLSMLPFAMVFEERRPQARELLLIAVMSAIAVVGRMAFFMIPQFKPVTAIVIITGICLGAEAGFLTGAMTGFVSNFFFGQGPWTPWQMFAFGIIGFLAGILFHKRKRENRKKHLILVCIYGGISTFLIYGMIMDLASVLSFTREITWEVLVATMLTGVPFNLIHGISTVLFLFFLAIPFEKKLDRIRKKYGILEV